MVYTTGNGVHGFTLDPSIGSSSLTRKTSRFLPKARYTALMKETPIRGTRDEEIHCVSQRERLRYGQAILPAVHRVVCRRFPQKPALWRHLPVSAIIKTPEAKGKIKAALRGQPARIHRRTSRRLGFHRQRAHPGYPGNRTAPKGTAYYWKQRGRDCL